MSERRIKLFWYRRDLRLDDNAGLYHALSEEPAIQVQPIFIFDRNILDKVNNPQDKRVPFIHSTVDGLKKKFNELGSDLWFFYGPAEEIIQQLLEKHSVHSIYTNKDYEPTPIKRDLKISEICQKKGVLFKAFKDQVVFEEKEVMSGQGKPYTVYTPYKKKWLESLSDFYLQEYSTEKYFKNLHSLNKVTSQEYSVPCLASMGFEDISKDHAEFYPSAVPLNKTLQSYDKTRDFPSLDKGTSKLGLHLRFGTVSVRKMAKLGKKENAVWLSELIWREFFMQVLYHFPHVVKKSFRPQYDLVEWRNEPAEFERWCQGQTGYPLVDAGMRELNATGHMHNRVRMVTASFLTKHLLHHWFQGERYFARQLLDYDLSANNGNWQWAAGTGCDAAPYFRVFNPETQAEKFDKKFEYIKKWVPEYGTSKYPEPMVEHKFARERCLAAFAKALKGK